MRILPVSLDSWNDLFNSLGVVLIGATFIVGLGALLTGRQINKRQAAALVTLSTELARAHTALAEQRTVAADAERRLLEIQKKLAPRVLSAQQQAEIAASVAPFAGVIFELFTYPGDQNPLRYQNASRKQLHRPGGHP